MTDQTQTVEQIAIARRVYAGHVAQKAEAAGAVVSLDWIEKVHAGEADQSHGVQIALATIRHLQEQGS